MSSCRLEYWGRLHRSPPYSSDTSHKHYTHVTHNYIYHIQDTYTTKIYTYYVYNHTHIPPVTYIPHGHYINTTRSQNTTSQHTHTTLTMYATICIPFTTYMPHGHMHHLYSTHTMTIDTTHITAIALPIFTRYILTTYTHKT